MKFGAERYVVYPFSQSGNCCFEATVVDTTKPESFKRLGMQHWEAVCECFDEESAKLIADALNKVKP